MGGVGIGGRMMFPLGIAPLLRNTSIRDNFALEVGADLLHGCGCAIKYGQRLFDEHWRPA
jgi:hypothetical protein